MRIYRVDVNTGAAWHVEYFSQRRDADAAARAFRQNFRKRKNRLAEVFVEIVEFRPTRDGIVAMLGDEYTGTYNLIGSPYARP